MWHPVEPLTQLAFLAPEPVNRRHWPVVGLAGCVPLTPRLITLSPCCLERLLGFGELLAGDVEPPLREPEGGVGVGELLLGSGEPVAQLPSRCRAVRRARAQSTQP